MHSGSVHLDTGNLGAQATSMYYNGFKSQILSIGILTTVK